MVSLTLPVFFAGLTFLIVRLLVVVAVLKQHPPTAPAAPARQHDIVDLTNGREGSDMEFITQKSRTHAYYRSVI